ETMSTEAISAEKCVRLQWGPSCVGADTDDAAERHKVAALQRGRRAVSAETRRDGARGTSMRCSFNGAAELRPRRPSLGFGEDSDFIKLKGGRRSSSADVALATRTNIIQQTMLQWGRRFSSADARR